MTDEQKRPGRPPVDDEVKKKRRAIWLSDPEWDGLADLAISLGGCTRSEAIRQGVLGHEPTAHPIAQATVTEKRLIGALGSVVSALEAYCDDHASERPTDPTVLLPMLYRIIRAEQ